MTNSFDAWKSENAITRVPIGLSEHQEQVIVVSWLRSWASKRWPQYAILGGKIPVTASANGGLRDPKTGSQLKKAGVAAGFPDLEIPVPCGRYHGLYIEMKTIKKGVVSAPQDAWLNALYRVGYRVVVARGHSVAIEEICNYFDQEEIK
jgi:hypothetical protein